MAALRSRAPQIGTAQWILNERNQAQLFIDQETEELSFAAKNDMEWLNEHMDEIFSRNQLHVADVFKTPGKLRGKTPRTARKRAPLESRAPLTDIFAPNTQNLKSPAHTTGFYKNVSKLQSSNASAKSQLRKSLNRQPPKPAPGKENIDSGYHGMPEDEMEIDNTVKPSLQQDPQPKFSSSSPPRDHSTPEWQQDERAEEGRTTEESFVSAKEAFGNKAALANVHHRDEDELTVLDDEMNIDEAAPPPPAAYESDIAPNAANNDESPEIQVHERNGQHIHPTVDAQDPAQTEDPMEVDDAQSPSDSSSSEKPLLRKSSLTFASLPARDPLGKTSLGNRASYIDQHRTPGIRTGSQVGNWNGGRSIGESQQINQREPQENIDSDENDASDREGPNSERTKKHNESATKRLHERITMLGQSKEPRASKSIPSIAAASQNMSSLFNKPETVEEPFGGSLHNNEGGGMEVDEDDDDDWIAPIDSQKNLRPPQRPHLAKSSSADVMEKISGKETIGQFDQYPLIRSATADRTGTSPARAQGSANRTLETDNVTSAGPWGKPMATGDASLKKMASISYPDITTAPGFVESTTPVGSPNSRRHPDGPLSASKAKLYSVLKSAKGIFASSAGVSAQAKMETLSTSVPRSKKPGQPYTGQMIQPDQIEEESMAEPVIASPTKANEGRKTRSSTEREEKKKEREAREQRLRDEQFAKAREQERLKAASQKLQRTGMEEQTKHYPAAEKASQGNVDGVEQKDAMLPPAVPKSSIPSQSQKPRRPMKPTKDPLPKAQPAPVSIRLPSQSKRIGQAPSANASQSSLQDSISSSQSKPSGPATRSHNASQQSSTSTNNFKSSTSGPAKPSSLQAAARKKEMEEKAAQRKAEQKRELERKRAAKQEEERRRIAQQEEERKQEQQRRAAEQQRMQEAKEAAQRKAQEQRKLEQQRLEQQRAQMLAKQKQSNDLAAKLQQEKAQAQAPPRADLGASRPVSRFNTIQDQTRPVPHPPINPAKPPKRPKPEDDNDQKAPQRVGPSYQQTEGKRRRTEEADEEEEIEPRHSVKAPPIRHSNMRKDAQKFPHGYTNAPPPAAHPPSMFRSTVTTQHQMQQSKAGVHPNEMAKFSSAKIPFAEVPNPPAGPSHSANTNFKTPARASQTQTTMSSTTTTTKVPLRSSPQYTPGENIALPDINTDSDDSDASTPDFRPPSWANSPALHELLTQQQLVDPETIFGPIAPLQMEEVFRNKDRHKRFRDRTSSANWSGQDRLTEEDKRKDREGRERVVRDGGWTYTGGK